MAAGDLGWTQWPSCCLPNFTIEAGATPDPTLTVVFVVLAVAAVLVLPSLGLLYWLSQRDLLEAEH